MNNLIVVPHRIKVGLYSIMVKEVGEELVCECGGCGKELEPRMFSNVCADSDWIFCSENCLQRWVDDNVNNKPEICL